MGENEPCAALVRDDPYLRPFLGALQYRYNRYKEMKAAIEKTEGSLDNFSKGYQRMGINKVPGGLMYREWAPGARRLSLIGDFNGWNREAHVMQRDEFGTWSIFIPNKPDGSCPIAHNTKLKVHVIQSNGQGADKVPAWANRVVQDPWKSILFDAQYWDPPEPYKWRNSRPPRPKNLRIYEAHVGMATLEYRVGTYVEFRDLVLPRIKHLGYTAVQIMAVMEHAYYASFGYHVTNFYAVSSRCGTPEELKSLIDRAHELGIVVLMDVVHSHASSNTYDGINYFDGTDHQYFHAGGKGKHDLWDSRLFNYGHWEVLRFLLSNLRWWMEEYCFDGFRFDGVTSMLYLHHGLGQSFSGGYHEYFSHNADMESLVYLMLANDMLHSLYPDVITIAEDVSGMPTLCRPISEGGVGFDYRLAMAIPDKWIKYLKELKDDQWQMGDITHTLTNRRWNEKTISYCESHDQALVGDKTIAFWLMDKEMYYNMAVNSPANLIVDRGLALHKLIRLVTIALGGEGYLTFMGNEFGHPEWIDFPRAGNNNSYQHARRQWNLPAQGDLKYKYLDLFDRYMNMLDETFSFQNSGSYVSLKHEDDKVVVFQHTGPARLLWVFNFHPTKSYTGYRIGTAWASTHRLILDSDDRRFGGQGRCDFGTKFVASRDGWHNRPASIMVYAPSRTAQVYALEEDLVHTPFPPKGYPPAPEPPLAFPPPQPVIEKKPVPPPTPAAPETPAAVTAPATPAAASKDTAAAAAAPTEALEKLSVKS